MRIRLTGNHGPLQDVHNPFAWVHLLAFLKRHLWWMLIVGASIGISYYSSCRKAEASLREQRDQIAAHFLTTHPLENPMGDPYPSIDPSGEIIYFINNEPESPPLLSSGNPAMRELTVWNYRTRTAVFQQYGPVVSPPIYSAAHNQIIVTAHAYEENSSRISLRMLARNRGTAHTILFFIDPETGRIERDLRVKGIVTVRDASPDGRWISATKRIGFASPFYPVWTNPELSAGQSEEIIIIGAQTGEVLTPNVRALTGLFDSSGDIILFRQDGIVRLLQPEWKPEAKPLVLMQSPQAIVLGEMISIRNSWMIHASPRKFFYQTRRFYGPQFAPPAVECFEMDDGTTTAVIALLPTSLMGRDLIKPHSAGIVNGDGIQLAAPDIEKHQLQNPSSTAWEVLNQDGQALLVIQAPSDQKPLFISNNMIMWASNGEWIIRSIDELRNAKLKTVRAGQQP